jgi:hypothetical protein
VSLSKLSTMSFNGSAQDIRVEDNHILRARLSKGDGEWVDAELDLNNCIGNNNGRLISPVN